MKFTHGMNDSQLKKTAAKLRKSPCLVCGKPATGLRKIEMNPRETAMVPVCADCMKTNLQTVLAAMKIADAMTPGGGGPWPGSGKTLRGKNK